MIERIKSAAIQHRGAYFGGENHGAIGRWMVTFGICPRPYPHGEAQGFLTESGRFVGRVEALQIAIAAGQVEKGKTSNPNELFSEDLKETE